MVPKNPVDLQEPYVPAAQGDGVSGAKDDRGEKRPYVQDLTEYVGMILLLLRFVLRFS